jgi:nucleoside-diphosphate-sugar epimerase
MATYIVFPSAIFGESADPIRALGIVQLLMYQKAKELGFIPNIGNGTAITNLIHVNAVTSFMLKVLDLSLEPSALQGSQYERTFFIGEPDIAWKEAAEVFAKAFHAKGIIALPDYRSVSLAEAGEGGTQGLMSHDMRFISPRAERLGYKYVQPDLPEYVRNGGDVVSL